jgi:hypothetical protein
MTLSNAEIVVTQRPDGRHAEAVFDLSRSQVAAAAGALSYYRRTRFGAAALGTGEALALRALGALAEQIDQLAALGGHAAVRIDGDGGSALVQAALAYLDERDTASYQSPEERERLAALRGLLDSLVEVTCELRRTEAEASSAIA